jgi:hypothetical protein
MPARNTDPSTSHAAADRIQHAAPGIEQDILDLLQEHPEGLTIQQISDLSGIGLVTVSPRLAPLRRRGQVHSNGKRKNPSGAMALVWVLGPGNSTPNVAPKKKAQSVTPHEWEESQKAYLKACEDLVTVMARIIAKRSITA